MPFCFIVPAVARWFWWEYRENNIATWWGFINIIIDIIAKIVPRILWSEVKLLCTEIALRIGLRLYWEHNCYVTWLHRNHSCDYTENNCCKQDKTILRRTEENAEIILRLQMLCAANLTVETVFRGLLLIIRFRCELCWYHTKNIVALYWDLTENIAELILRILFFMC